jgi:oligosaccharide repeat unit polymerase
LKYPAGGNLSQALVNHVDELLLTLFVAIILGGRSLWRLFSDRFPHPVDLAVTSIFYYSFPLAIVAAVLKEDGGLVFLHEAAGDYSLALRSMNYAVLAAVSLHCGRFLGRHLRKGTTYLIFPIGRRDFGKVQFFLVFLLCQLTIGIVLFGADALFAGYNIDSQAGTAATGQAVLYSGIELMGLTIAYAYLVSIATRRWPSPKLILFCVIVIFLLGVARGKRLEVVSAFLPLALFIFATKPAFRRRSARLVVIVVTALFISLLASIRLGEPPNIASLMFNLFSEGLFAGHALPGLLENLTRNGATYEYGFRVVAGLLAFVPRFLWPGKDEMLYSATTVFEGVAPLGATSMLGEVYLQGGVVAIIVFFLIVGYIFEYTCQFQSSFDSQLISKQFFVSVLPYLACVAIFIPHFRDGLIPSMKISLQAMFFLFLVAGLKWFPSLNWSLTLHRRMPPNSCANRTT